MTVVIGFLILLIFYFLGQAISYLIGGLLPGNIIGMILLFAALYFKLIKPSYLRSIARGLTKNMAILFIPAGVGLMTSTDLISKYWLILIVSCFISSILIIAVVALIQQKLENRRNLKQNDKAL